MRYYRYCAITITLGVTVLVVTYSCLLASPVVHAFVVCVLVGTVIAATARRTRLTVLHVAVATQLAKSITCTVAEYQ
jgi:hypothetical protein